LERILLIITQFIIKRKKVKYEGKEVTIIVYDILKANFEKDLNILDYKNDPSFSKSFLVKVI
jgi:hypothetical protein